MSLGSQAQVPQGPYHTFLPVFSYEMYFLLPLLSVVLALRRVVSFLWVRGGWDPCFTWVISGDMEGEVQKDALEGEKSLRKTL